MEIDPDGSYRLSRPQRGDTVDSVLRYVHFDASELLERYRKKLQGAGLDTSQHQEYLDELENGLYGYTYLEE